MKLPGRLPPAIFFPAARSLLGGLPLLLLAGLALPMLAVASFLPAALREGNAPVLAAALVSAQFVVLLFALRAAFRHRIGRRLEQLAAAADALADGCFDPAAGLGGGDEIGRLGNALDRLRRLAGDRLAESDALFDAAPVGLLLVRNRVIERASRRAEALLGVPRGHLRGRPTEAIYPARGDFIDVGARAYAAIERGEVFAAPVTLTRQDGATFSAVLAGSALDPRAPQDGSVWAIVADAR